MAYSIQDWQNDVASSIHGTTINKVPNIYGIANRTARAVLTDVNPKETQRIVQLSQVFNNVFDYAIPVDVKGDDLIDIRPQAGRKPSDIFQQGYEQNFDANKNVSIKNKIYTQWNTGVKTIRIEAPTLTAPITLTDTSTIAGWTATSGASTPTLDPINNVAGGGALVTNLAVGQASGSLQISTLNPTDYTSYLNVATGFLWVYLPTGSAVTSITLRWGSDITANYYTQTATTTQQGLSFQNGWNLLAFPWATASVVGSPVITTTKAVQVIFNYNSALQTGVKVCNLTFNLGYIFEAVYYSKYLFRDPVTNAFQEKVVDTTDINKLINLDTDSYNLFFNKSMAFIAQSLMGADASYDAIFYGGNPDDDPKKAGGGEYGKALRAYIAKNPSESMLKSSSYYTVKSPRYGFNLPRSPYQ